MSISKAARSPLTVSVLAFVALPTLTAIIYGYSYKVTNFVEMYFGAATILYAGIASICVGAIWRHQSVNEAGTESFFRLLGGTLTAVSIIVTCYFRSAWLPLPWTIPAALAVVLGLLAATKFSRGALLALVALGAAMLATMPFMKPLEILGANMLPIIEAACAVYARGDNPFIQYPEIATTDFRYLPGVYLPYCMIQQLGFDVRILNIVILLVILALGLRFMDGWHQPETVTVALCPVLFSSASAQMIVNGHVWLYWLFVVCLGLLVLRGRLFVASMLAGAMIATRQQSALLLIPALGILLSAVPPLKLLQMAAVATIVAILGLLPAILQVPDFVDYFFFEIPAVAKLTQHAYGNPSDQIALSGLLASAGLHDVLVPLQVLVMFALAVVFALRPPRSWEMAVMLLGASYLLVVSLSTQLHRYFLIPGLLLMSITLSWHVHFGSSRTGLTGDTMRLNRSESSSPAKSAASIARSRRS